jgi:hypothetical protein
LTATTGAYLTRQNSAFYNLAATLFCAKPLFTKPSSSKVTEELNMLLGKRQDNQMEYYLLVLGMPFFFS